MKQLCRFDCRVGPSRIIERGGGGESILDNFNLNLLQLVIAHIPSTEQPKRSCTIHINLRGNPNERKPLNAFLILYKDYIHFPTPTGWEHQLPDL